jgi:hypothetical protein
LQRYRSSIDRSSKARLLSASQPSASTWLTTIPEENDLSLNDSQFCAAIRHRLAIPTQSKCCQCEPEARIINDSIHPHTCKLLKKEEINQRHECIVYTLRQLCDLANQHSSLHHRLNYDNIDKNIRPDLYVYINGTAYMIDVSIVCPAASSHVYSHNADEIPLSSAIHRGKEKVRKYRRLARQNHMKFVPFILESFGAVDKQARSFISLLAEQTNDPHQFFAYCMRRLSIALQRGNSDIQTRGIQRLLLDQSFSVNDRHQQVPNILFYNDASSSDSDRDCSSSEDSDWDGEGDGDINDDDQRNDWDWIGRMEEGRMGNE